MKRIESMNGYAIYQAGARDVDKYGVEEGAFNVYFSSDIRDFGLANSEPEFEGLETLEAAEACCTGNYAKAREIVEARTTAASFEEIAEVEAQLDAGTIDEDGEPIEDELDPDDTLTRCGRYKALIETANPATAEQILARAEADAELRPSEIQHVREAFAARRRETVRT